jgi:hypothetical protein
LVQADGIAASRFNLEERDDRAGPAGGRGGLAAAPLAVPACHAAAATLTRRWRPPRTATRRVRARRDLARLREEDGQQGRGGLAAAAGRYLNEPWVFVIGPDGKISTRLDNVATQAELQAALQRLPAPDQESSGANRPTALQE